MTLFTKADLCLEELDIECAQETVSRLQQLASPLDNVSPASSFLKSSGRLQLLKIRLNSVDETAGEQARRIEKALFSGLDLAPRQVGRVRVRLAQLYSADGKMEQAKRSLEAALSADMESAAARFWLGALRLREGRSKQALSDFRACVRSRPAEHDCHRGVIHALLELDRVEEARLHVVGHEAVLGEQDDQELFSAWLALAAEEDGAEVLSRFELGGPRSKFVAGIAHGRAGQGALAESLLIESAEGLESSLNALDQWMAPRAYAAAARFGESEHRQTQADRAYLLGPGDPAVLVDLGWYYDSLGNKEEGVLFFDRVDGVGQESAISHFNRGWFFLDFGDNQVRTKASWIRYRDLKPSGPRAERVMRQLLELY
jgi:tetratricopeptide (TPR) repeat protein